MQVTHDKSIHTFERAISNNAFEYLYNEVEVSLGEYLTKLTNLSLRNCMSTMFINLDLMNVYVSFSDKDRSNMIEQLCASCLEKPSYDKLNNKLQINKKELNFAMQRQKYLTSQRNELKKRKVLTDNLNNTKRTFEENRREFYYFKLFHNKNAVTDLELELMETQKQYDAFLIQSFNTSNKITQVEKKKHDLCNEIKVSRGALQFSVQMRIKFLNSSLVKKQIGKLENDITDINYVVGQNNVEQIQNTIKILEDRLETIDDAKKMWCTAYNSSKLHEYSKLQMDFEDKFPEMVVKSSSSIYEMKLISIEINRHNQVLVKQKKVLKNLQNLKCKLDSEMVALKDELTKSEQNAKEIHNYGELIEKITTIIGNAKQSRNDEFYNNKLGLKSTQLDNIVNILKSKNPGVYGRVSEFTRSHNAILQDALKCRFGSCYDAIIVDTKETAIECISLLNKLKLTEHNETFLFVPGLKLKDTEHFMVDKEGVKNIKFEYIENVLCDNMESIKNALISCASKTIFCKTYDDAVMVFDLEKNNVNVVSTDEQLLFERSGFITKGSKEAGAEISDAELHDYKVQKLESEVKVRELLLQQKESKIMLMSDIPITEKKLIKILEEISNISKEIENIEKIINKLSKKCDALKLKSNHEENPTEYEFFGEFCKQLNIPNIAEYRQKMLSPNASSTISEINDRWNACKMELDKSKFTVNKFKQTFNL